MTVPGPYTATVPAATHAAASSEVATICALARQRLQSPALNGIKDLCVNLGTCDACAAAALRQLRGAALRLAS